MQIAWHVTAREDLDSIYVYIFNDNPSAAKSLVENITYIVETRLPSFPLSGRLGRIGGTRELVISKTSYIVVYRVIDEYISILSIKHTSREWPKKF